MKKPCQSRHLLLFLSIALIVSILSACNPASSTKIPPAENTEIRNSQDENPTAMDPPQENNDLEDTRIEVFKEERLLKLYVDGALTETFKIALGPSPSGDKNKQGDKRTPTGEYFVCTRNDRSRFTLFLGLSYPNAADAKRGLENGLIGQATYEAILDSDRTKTAPPWNTPLGGEIGIHGGGTSSDWTLGCIALSDDDIKTLWEYSDIGLPVHIYE